MTMDFQLSEEQQQLKDSTRRFAREQLPEIAEEIERTGKPVDSKLLRQFADLGFLGVNIPEEFGGMGLGNLEALIVLRSGAHGLSEFVPGLAELDCSDFPPAADLQAEILRAVEDAVHER